MNQNIPFLKIYPGFIMESNELQILPKKGFDKMCQRHAKVAKAF